MTQGPRKSIAPSHLPREAQEEIDQVVEDGVGEMSLRELLAATLSALGEAERTRYLAQAPEDKGNGSYARSVTLGSIPLDLRVARTRSGEFRPAMLPGRYQRSYPDEMQALLLGLLASSRSINAAKASLKKMGLSSSEQDLEIVAAEFVEELELRNSRTLDSDLLGLFFDGKHVEVREGDRIRPACIYVAIGLTRDGKKRILACVTHFGQENLEDWRKVIRGLLERGLRRVLIVVQDDFSGLLALTRGFFPQADVQLCIVHLQRNAGTHLAKAEVPEFQQRMRTLKASWDAEVGATQFENLCERFASMCPTWIAELRKKREHYLAFLKYPAPIRRTVSTTNAVEAVNGQLERMRRNNGGYFHSQTTLALKLAMAISHLETGSWRRLAANVQASLAQLNAMFDTRFESESRS